MAFAGEPPPSDDQDVEALDRQVKQLEQAGKYSEAVPIATKLLERCKELMGPEHPANAVILDKLGRLYTAAGDYSKAERLLQDALKIYENTLGPEDVHTATTINNLAEVYRYMGDYAKAEPLYERVLRIDEKHEGANRQSGNATLNNLALVYTATGKYKKAEDIYAKILAISERTVGPEHPDTAAICNNFADLYQAMGDYGKAEQLCLRALKIDEKALGPEHPTIATLLSSLGALYEQTGDFAKAKSVFQRALNISEKALGPEHPSTAQNLNNLAALYEDIADYASARPLYQRALEIRKKVLGQDSPLTATTLNNLAGLYRSIGDYAHAEPLLQESSRIYEKTFGNQHRTVALALNNLAYLYEVMGAFVSAEPLYQQALRIDETALGENHPDTAVIMSNLGTLYNETGDYAKAEPLLQRALTISRKVFGPEHPRTATILNNLAILELDLANIPEARALAQRSGKAQLKALSTVLSFCSEPQRLAYQNTVDPYGVFAAINGSDSELALACLRYKGVVLDSIIEDRVLAEASRNKEQRETVQRLNTDRQRLGQLLLETPKASDDQSTKQIEQLEREIEQIEGDLGRHVAGLGRARRALTVTVEAVQTAIPTNGALIEYLRYPHYLGRAKFEPHYGAIVLLAKGKPRWIPIGKAEEIEKSVMRYRSQVADQETTDVTLRETLRALFDQVWAAVQQVLPVNTRTVIISPDAQLNFVSFATLLSPKDQFLAEDHTIQYVSSGRDLLRDITLAANSQLIAFGNPDFGVKPPPAEKIEPIVTQQVAFRGKTREALEELGFRALKGTEKECAILAERAKQWKWPCSRFLAADATEAELRKCKSPYILHLATHGFFIDVKKEDRTQLGLTSPFEMRKSRYFENPMHRAGLALAGARATIDAWRKGETPPTENDGIVTAEEVSTLKLNGTWLVTLSACDTGTGEAKSGEGVLGLRRGFIQAGAKNLLMTLWPISDEDTVYIMARFYDAAHRTGNAPRALADVQRDWLVKLRKTDGLTKAVNLAGPFILNSQGKP
jgi:tetratricopeptide (TPR) repeat protein